MNKFTLALLALCVTGCGGADADDLTGSRPNTAGASGAGGSGGTEEPTPGAGASGDASGGAAGSSSGAGGSVAGNGGAGQAGTSPGGAAGSASASGFSGTAGAGSTAGSSGTGGTAGASGAGGSAGKAGASGAGGSAGADSSVVLWSDTRKASFGAQETAPGPPNYFAATFSIDASLGNGERCSVNVVGTTRGSGWTGSEDFGLRPSEMDCIQRLMICSQRVILDWRSSATPTSVSFWGVGNWHVMPPACSTAYNLANYQLSLRLAVRDLRYTPATKQVHIDQTWELRGTLR